MVNLENLENLENQELPEQELPEQELVSPDISNPDVLTPEVSNISTSPLSLLYTGICNIYSYISTVDPITKVTSQHLSLIYKNIPCRASYYTMSSNSSLIKNSDFNYSKNNSIKLFLQSDLIINSGSIFQVTQNNRTTKYKASSEAFVFSNHQEIILKLLDDLS